MFDLRNSIDQLILSLTRPWSIIICLFSDSAMYKALIGFKGYAENNSSIFVVGVVVCAVVMYFLEAEMLRKLAGRLNLSHSWLAFVPILNSCLLGPIIFNKDKDKVRSSLCTALLLWFSTFLLCAGLDKVAGVFSIFVYDLPILIVQMFYNYKLYSMLSKKAKPMIIFDIITCGRLSPILAFAVRNNEFIEIDK